MTELLGPAIVALENELARRIRDSGQRVTKIYRVYAPLDTGGEAEVLFLGPANEPLTAYVSDDGTPVIAAGW